MGEYAKSGRDGWVAGVCDTSPKHKPVKAAVKKAKYGWHKKDLSKTRVTA